MLGWTISWGLLALAILFIFGFWPSAIPGTIALYCFVRWNWTDNKEVETKTEKLEQAMTDALKRVEELELERADRNSRARQHEPTPEQEAQIRQVEEEYEASRANVSGFITSERIQQLDEQMTARQIHFDEVMRQAEVDANRMMAEAGIVRPDHITNRMNILAEQMTLGPQRRTAIYSVRPEPVDIEVKDDRDGVMPDKFNRFEELE